MEANLPRPTKRRFGATAIDRRRRSYLPYQRRARRWRALNGLIDGEWRNVSGRAVSRNAAAIQVALAAVLKE
jgi:hypothetical protein